jgi:hypothetical protein
VRGSRIDLTSCMTQTCLMARMDKSVLPALLIAYRRDGSVSRESRIFFDLNAFDFARMNASKHGNCGHHTSGF